MLRATLSFRRTGDPDPTGVYGDTVAAQEGVYHDMDGARYITIAGQCFTTDRSGQLTGVYSPPPMKAFLRLPGMAIVVLSD